MKNHSKKPTRATNNEFYSDYLWKYFELHARQRITLFSFFTGFCAIFISAIGYLFTKIQTDTADVAYVLFILSLFLIIATWIFASLDKRNRQLIHYAEDSLRYLESLIPIKPYLNIREFQIFTKEKEDKNNGKALPGHTDCFKYLFYCSYCIGAILLLFSLHKLGFFIWLCDTLKLKQIHY